jgi:hypothetical protein
MDCVQKHAYMHNHIHTYIGLHNIVKWMARAFLGNLQSRKRTQQLDEWLQFVTVRRIPYSERKKYLVISPRCGSTPRLTD